MIVFEPWVDLRAMIIQTHEHKFAGNKRLCPVPDVKYKCISWRVSPHSCPCVRHICASTTWTYPKCTCTRNFRTRDHLHGTHCFSPMSPLVVPGGSQKSSLTRWVYRSSNMFWVCPKDLDMPRIVDAPPPPSYQPSLSTWLAFSLSHCLITDRQLT